MIDRFPSPIGELHFSIVMGLILISVVSTVSVPYRGATFLNQADATSDETKCVSVPYRGATFLNCVLTFFSNQWLPVSVPYRGATFLNQDRIYDDARRKGWFPSPIGELHFSIEPIKRAIPYLQSFRPLSGSYISQF